MATDSPTNSFVQDGKLYIIPTLTSDAIGKDAVFNGYTYNLTGCTNEKWQDCGVVSNSTTGIVINPVQSARLTTRKSHSIQFGKVEVVAKIPRGYGLACFVLHLHIYSLMSLKAIGSGPRFGCFQ
jgi:hypothetical protein